jgi:hypothetical protein
MNGTGTQFRYIGIFDETLLLLSERPLPEHDDTMRLTALPRRQRHGEVSPSRFELAEHRHLLILNTDGRKADITTSLNSIVPRAGIFAHRRYDCTTTLTIAL